jgi:hypothetical protein
MFANKAGATPSEPTLRFSTLGQAPSLTIKYYTRLKRPARDKHSSLSQIFVNYGRKKFYNINVK